VNNVGIFEVKDFFAVDDAEWLRYVETNFMSGVRLARHYLPEMLTRNSGRIMFISSEAGVRPIPVLIPYSKAMQISVARGLAELTKGTRVTVNSVLPGPTMTEGVMKAFGMDENVQSDNEETPKPFFDSASLIQRFLDPDEVANATLYLGSAMGSGTNGAAFRVEGGIIRHM